jgi:50S ribosomal subunit-associated GTPase HflX
LEQDLQESQRVLQQLSADQETVLRAVASEVDTLVSQFAHDIHSSYPTVPSSVGTESDIRKWVADMISKLKWLQQEISFRFERDAVLKQQVARGHEHAEVSMNTKSFNLNSIALFNHQCKLLRVKLLE